MNILVTGANGQLGNEMRIVSIGSADRYVFTDVNDMPGQETVLLDITDLGAVRAAVKEYQADVIINCAAYTNVDKAENEAATASISFSIDATAPVISEVVYSDDNGLLGVKYHNIYSNQIKWYIWCKSYANWIK